MDPLGITILILGLAVVAAIVGGYAVMIVEERYAK